MENENVSDIKWTWIQREKKNETDKQAGRRSDTDSKEGIQKDRQTNRQADSQTQIAKKGYRKTDRQTGR